MDEESQTNKVKLKVIIRPNRFPIEGKTGTISFTIIPLNDFSHKEFEVSPSLRTTNILNAEIWDPPKTIDLSKGKYEGERIFDYPICSAAAIRVYVLGLGDNDVIQDYTGTDMNSTLTDITWEKYH